MENKKISIGISDIILLIASIIFFIGMLTFLRPCSAMEDGTWMTCHWAGQAIKGLAAVLVGISLIHGFVSNPHVKIGVSLAAIPVAVLTVLIPGGLIQMCMMNTMRCHAVMRPGATIFSVVTIAAAIFDIFCQRKKL